MVEVCDRGSGESAGGSSESRSSSGDMSGGGSGGNVSGAVLGGESGRLGAVVGLLEAQGFNVAVEQQGFAQEGAEEDDTDGGDYLRFTSADARLFYVFARRQAVPLVAL